MKKLIPLIFTALLLLGGCQNEPENSELLLADPTQEGAAIPPPPQLVTVEIEATAEVLSSGATDEDLDLSLIHI